MWEILYSGMAWLWLWGWVERRVNTAGARGGGAQSSEATEGDTAQLEIVADLITTSSAIFNSLMVDSFRNGSAIDHSELISES